MNRIKKIAEIRRALSVGRETVGSWMQLSDASVAEIMGQAGYDWVAIDLEHGSISTCQLPNLFRALELGGTLPLARLSNGSSRACKQALDAGAGGVIVPMIESYTQLNEIRGSCCWPPSGTRGVGFSRANLFGRNFEDYHAEAQAPILVAMIEHWRGVDSLEDILRVKGLDAILVGPYDLSASLGCTGDFTNQKFTNAMTRILEVCGALRVPCGIHIVSPSEGELMSRISEGYQFIAYSIDSVFLTHSSVRPKII